MIIYKCKMCGGDLEIQDGMGVCECAYCGTKQTLPKLNDEKRVNLYDRANHFRRNNEFDKAMAMYEQILAEDREDAEAYWSLVLCTYGVEYVEDPVSHRKVPTVNRTQYTSVFMDENYKAALQYADSSQKQIYQNEAEQIDAIQKGILDISSKEKPYDIFICYKETDAQGERTPDSVLAQDLYYQLTQEGLKVFFARITLEDKLGSAYEPYIFAALNSAKVMVVLGTKAEYFNAVWVKNEWSRYLNLIKGGAKKVLIPAYKDMDPYDMPQEFSHLQAQNMGKLGFVQDLLRGIKKIVGVDSTPLSGGASGSGQQQETSALIKRVFLVLEDGDFARADELCEKVLNQDPENGEAYLGKLMISLRVDRREKLAQLEKGISKLDNYAKIMRFGSDALKAEVEGYQQQIIERQYRLKEENDARVYKDALGRLQRSKKSEDINVALEQFKTIADYKDAAERIKEAEKKLQQAVKAEFIRKVMLIAGAVLGVVVLILVIKGYKSISSMISQHNYEKEVQARAEEYMQQARYDAAYDLYYEISQEAIWTMKMYSVLTDCLDKEEYETAIQIYYRIKNHGEAELTDKMINTLNIALSRCIENGELETADSIIWWLSTEGATEKMGDILNAALEWALENGKAETAEQIYQWLIDAGISVGDEALESVKEAQYNLAMEYYEKGEYVTAGDMFAEITGYRDALEMAVDAWLKNAEKAIDNGELEYALQTLEDLRHSGWIDSTSEPRALNDIYNLAAKYGEMGDYVAAYDVYESLNGYSNAEKAMADIYRKRFSQILKETEEYDVVTFGRYEQDNNVENGMEDIRWIVLDKQDDRCLLISESILDCVGIKNEQWENSGARKWMNSTFYETAFNSVEKEIIINATLEIDTVNFPHSYFSIDDTGRRTSDKVFALSLSECKQYLLQFDVWSSFSTPYARERFWGEEFNFAADDFMFYLLRTTFCDADTSTENTWVVAFYNDYYDYFTYYDEIHDESGRGIPCGVRPGIWVEID